MIKTIFFVWFIEWFREIVVITFAVGIYFIYWKGSNAKDKEATQKEKSN